MAERGSNNEMSVAGIILFAIGVATLVSVPSLPVYYFSGYFIVGLVGGLLVGAGLVLILRSNTRRALAQ